MTPRAQPQPGVATTRLDGLDMVRAAAMLLGVVYHAAFAYVPGMGRWYFVEDVSTAPALGTLELVLHGFRMQVFFALSGLFAHLVLDKRGPDGFLADRFRRLMVPFLCGAPLVVLADYGLRAWASARGLLRADWGAGWLFRPLHLWFLEYLFLFVLAAWALRRVGVRAPWLARAFAAGVRVPELFLGGAALTFAVLEWLPEPTPAMSFVPQPSSVAYYLPFFVFGWLLWSALDRAQPLRRTGWMVVPGLLLAGWTFSREVQWQTAGHATAAVVAWLMVLGCLGLALRVEHAPRPALASAVEASYWVYLVHHPLVVAAQLALATVPLGAWTKYLLVVAGVSAVAFASFRVLVRPTPLAPWLGVRRPAG